MKFPTPSEGLFSIKCFAASMLALYLALRIGLPRPFWGMMTAYIVANPISGAVRSKGVYRVSGTILGSVPAILLVPRLANAPELLSLVLALWVGVCLYISLLDRTPRSYVFMLAGYTAALIGFPAVADPGTIFDVAVARVEEILLGIGCATLVHSLVFPQSLGPVLLARLDRAISDVKRWLRDALGGVDADRGVRDRRRLAGDITELRLMSSHLPFDTSHLRWTSSAIHALQDRLSAMVSLLSGVEDRLRTLRGADGAAPPQHWRMLLADIVEWGQSDGPCSGERAAELRKRITNAAPAIGPGASWSQVLMVNLAARLHALVDVCEDFQKLRRHIDEGVHGALPVETRQQPASSYRALHLDHRLALQSGFAAAIAIVMCCAFWIGTAWSSGATAAMMASIFCCFFATQDNPVPTLKKFFNYSVLSMPISALYLLILVPAAHSFETLVLVMAPFFLALGIYIARPATLVQAMALLTGVTGMLALQDTGTADIVSLVNNSLAQLCGIGIAALCTSLFRSISAERMARRILHAGWADLARLGKAEHAPAAAAVSVRMLDRISLLTPRLAMAGPQQDLTAVDALNDLRIGLNMTHLLRVRLPLEDRGVALRPLLLELSDHFQERRVHRTSAAPASLLDRIDATLRAVCASRQTPEQRAAVAALVGIRRDLFPAAASYQPALVPSAQAR